jgi:N-acetylglucosaminyldiphosphoundecaprenol N-acetyl-beta-D-mannosaminyltransferase
MNILNTRYDDLKFGEALERVLALMDKKPKSDVYFLNIDCLYRADGDAEYRDILNRAALVLPDGIGLKVAAKLLGQSVRDNCNGTDLCPKLMQAAAERGYKVFLLGGRDGVAADAAKNLLARLPTLKIVGTHSGFFASDQPVVQMINASGADILLVAMGVPLQEKWIHCNRSGLNPRLCLGVGALLDFWSGRVRRAPRILRALKLEWLWRTFQEPGRLWKRYFVDDMKFLIFILRKRIRR